MRKTLITMALAVLPLTAAANWKVSQDGMAMVENGGESALALRCDNNANTGNRPSWRIEVTALDLNQLGPQTEMVFRFPGQAPLRLMGEHRLGKVFLDGMNLPSQSDLTTLVRRLKASSRVTLTLIDNNTGLTAGDPLAFNLRGSSRVLNQTERACR